MDGQMQARRRRTGRAGGRRARTATTTGATMLAALALVTTAGGAAAPAGAQSAATGSACTGLSGCTVVSTADVDGDGRRDSVGLYGWRSDTVGVKVRTAAGRSAWKRVSIDFLPDHARDRSAFIGAARVDGAAGHELVVRKGLGAHTSFFTVLSWRDGRLATLKDPGGRYEWITDGALNSGFGYRRSVSAGGTVKMVAHQAIGDGTGRYRVTDRAAIWKGGRWVRTSTRTSTTTSVDAAHRDSGWHVPYLPVFP